MFVLWVDGTTHTPMLRPQSRIQPCNSSATKQAIIHTLLHARQRQLTSTALLAIASKAPIIQSSTRWQVRDHRNNNATSPTTNHILPVLASRLPAPFGSRLQPRPKPPSHIWRSVESSTQLKNVSVSSVQSFVSLFRGAQYLYSPFDRTGPAQQSVRLYALGGMQLAKPQRSPETV